MALGTEIYEAIEIAFRTSGAAGIADLQAKVAALQATVAGYDAALKSNTITHSEFIDKTKDEIEQIQRLNEVMAAGQRVMAGQSAMLKDTQSSARGTTQAMLELSRGIEDFAVSGPIGALNNVPGIIQGIGRAAGLAGPMVAGLTAGVSLLGTAAYVAYKNWDAIEKALGLGLPVKPLEDVKALEAALKDLTDKKWKTSIDFQDIENLEARVEEVKRAQAGLKKLSGDDEATKKRAGMVTDALVEGSGGGDAGRRKFIDAAVAAAMGPVQPEVAKFNADLAAIDAKIAEATKAGDGNLVLGLMKSKEVIQNTDRAKVAQTDANRREAVGRQVGSAMMGDEAQRRWLSDLVAGHEDKFAAQGFDTLRIRGGLEAAAPDTLFAEERAKLAQANDVKAKAAQAKRDQATAENIRHEQQMAEKAERDKAKAQRDKEQAGAEQVRIDQKLEADRNRKITEAANAVDQGFTGRAAALYAENDARRIWSEQDKLLGGQGLPEARNDAQFKRHIRNNQAFTVPDEAMGNFVRGRIGNDIARGGRVNRELIPEVAAQVEQRGSELYRTKKTEALGRTAMPDPAQFGALGPAGAETMATLSQAQSAIAQAQAGLLGSLGQTRQTAERAMQTALGVGGQAAQMRTRGPSASPLVRRGM